MPPVQVEMSRTSRWRKMRWRLSLAAAAVLLEAGAMEVVVLQVVAEEVLPAAVVVVLAGVAGRLAEEDRLGFQGRRLARTAE